MELYKKTPLKWNNENYEIRVLYDDSLINVLTFHKNHPANGFRHQIRLPKGCNVEEILGQDIVGELVGISKNEIVKDSWGKLAEII
jgi:hypothetical protein